jgi:aspartate/methionine/tyrosine aminotransferase
MAFTTITRRRKDKTVARSAKPLASIDLSRAEVLLPMSEALSFAASRILIRHQGYAPPAGIPSVREAIADHLSRLWSTQIEPAEILITGGGSLGFAVSVLRFTSPDDVVLVPKPSYPNFRRCLLALGRGCMEYPVNEASGEPDFDVIAHMRGNARALVCVNPQNPLGTVLSAAALSRLHQTCDSMGLVLIEDVAFQNFVWSDNGSSSPVRRGAHAVLVGSLSKSLGMPGLRLGWVWAPKASIDLMAQTHWALAMSANTFSQQLAGVALAPEVDWPATVRAAARKTIDRVVLASNRKGLRLKRPDAGLSFWVNVSPFGFDTQDATEEIRQSAGILVRSGSDFSSTDKLRIRAGLADTEEESEAGYSRLASYLIGRAGHV